MARPSPTSGGPGRATFATCSRSSGSRSDFRGHLPPNPQRAQGRGRGKRQPMTSPTRQHPFGPFYQSDGRLEFLACPLEGRRLQRRLHEQAFGGHPIVAKVADGIVRPRDVLKHQVRHLCAFLHASSFSFPPAAPCPRCRLQQDQKDKARPPAATTASEELSPSAAVPTAAFPTAIIPARGFPDAGALPRDCLCRAKNRAPRCAGGKPFSSEGADAARRARLYLAEPGATNALRARPHGASYRRVRTARSPQTARQQP